MEEAIGVEFLEIDARDLLDHADTINKRVAVNEELLCSKRLVLPAFQVHQQRLQQALPLHVIMALDVNRTCVEQDLVDGSVEQDMLEMPRSIVVKKRNYSLGTLQSTI